MAFEDEPAVAPMGMDELIEQSGLAHTGLAHQPHHLPLSRFDMAQEFLQMASSRSRPTNRLRGRCPYRSSGDRRGLSPTTL